MGRVEESTGSVGCHQLLKLGLAPHCLNREAQRTGIGTNTQDWREQKRERLTVACQLQVTFLQWCWTLVLLMYLTKVNSDYQL